MSKIGERERITQNRIVALFRDTLGYKYLGNFEDRPQNSNIETNLLEAYLKEQKVKKTLIDKVLFEVGRVAGDQSKSLYEVNKEVYSLLRYGVKVKEDVGENTKTVDLINWKEPLKNHFAIAEILSDMDAEISALEQKREKTRLLKQGMMQELLTGRIRLV